MSARLRPVLLLGTSAALALGLSACKLDNRPLLARNGAPAPADYAYAPSAAALPYADPAQVLPATDAYDGYALAQRAYAHDRVAYREPPEYGFQYGDVEPWVWQAEDDDLMFAEPIDDGYRFYYYEPGEAYPYFVRDRDYGYAYGSGGVLAALFDATGALLPQDRLYREAPVAGRYLARGHDLRQVYYREPRIPVAEPAWTRRAPVIEAAQRPWIAAAERQPAFRERPRRDVRTFDPIPGPREQVLADRRHEDRRAFAPNVQQHAAQASARIEDHQARDLAREQRRAAMDQARAQRQVARAEPPKAFERHGGGRHEERSVQQAAPQPQPQPQRQAFNAPHGGGNGHHQDRPAPAPAAPAAPAQPQAGGDHGHGGDHGNHGGGKDHHDKH